MTAARTVRGGGARTLFFLTLLLAGCGFSPNLDRFAECGADRTCAAGFTCLTEANRCVPLCGDEPCPIDPIDSGFDAGPMPSDAGMDAGFDAGIDAGFDAGVDAGTEDAGTEDAGEDAGVDAGIDAGPDALALSNAPLAPAIELAAYSVQFVPTGGVPGYLFSIDGGVPGFALQTDGTFSAPDGGANQSGFFPFSITVVDSDAPTPARVTNAYTLHVRPLLRVANAIELNEGRVSRAYDEPLQAHGGQAPYSWRVPDGGLPAWASINAGRIVGNPAAGNATFTLEVTDSAMPPQIATRRVQLTSAALDLVLTNATPALPDGRVDAGYTHTLRAGATLTGNFNWSVFGGSLPPGLMLTNSPPIGVISGTPTMAGSFPVTIRVTDGVTPVNRMYTITVFPR
ncbi:MAG: putative Ig domain-containing protein [Archangium sp.]|nr:putative Ig domain-containing protein [Archangium sp.]